MQDLSKLPVEELNTWKEIADYLDVSVRTAQHWQKEYGLPVRRLPGSKSRVFALRHELDAWKFRSPDMPLSFLGF